MNNNQKQPNGFFNGFLWGAVLGAGIVFIVGTKKGKKLLKVLTQEGLEGVADLGDIIDDLNEEEKENQVENAAPVSEGLKNNPRRFFRRKASNYKH